MKRTILPMISLLVLLGAVNTRAAQHGDLVCEHVADRSAAATPDARTAPGLEEGCTLRAAAVRVCSEESGDAGADDRICYPIECPPRPARTVRLRDRFGAHALTLEQPRTVCLPGN
jgi:hypothetical protein